MPPNPSLHIDNEALRAFPVTQRWAVQDDFDQAVAHWSIARREREIGDRHWFLSLRRAIRFWQHYKAAIRAARNMKVAA